MLSKFTRLLWCFPLVLVVLAGDSTLLIAPAVAQRSNANNLGSGAVNTREVTFEVASIRPVTPGSPYDGTAVALGNVDPAPSGFTSTLTLWQVLMIAYGPDDRFAWNSMPIVNGPKWLSNIPPDLYTIRAHVPEAEIAAWRNQSSHRELLRSAMQDLLKKRCRLIAHEEPIELPDTKLVIAKRGVKMTPWVPGSALPQGAPLRTGGVRVPEGPRSRTTWHFYGATLGELVAFLQATSADRPIHDGTGLTGRYDYTVQMVEDPSHEPSEQLYNWPVAPLGLALKPGKYLGSKLVIDHMDKPISID